MTVPSSLVVIVPSPSLSNREKAVFFLDLEIFDKKFKLAKEESAVTKMAIMRLEDVDFESDISNIKKEILKSFFSLLEEKEAAYDINHYPSAPPGIRIWGGGTVETSNIELLLPWLDWAWEYIEK